MKLQSAKIAASVKKGLTDKFWASEGRDSVVETHLSHAVREVTEVIYTTVTGPLAEFARVKSLGMRAAFIKLAKYVETTRSKFVSRSRNCYFA